jgi:hypothetical protein
MRGASNGYQAVDRAAYAVRLRPRVFLSVNALFYLGFTVLWVVFAAGWLKFAVLLFTVPVLGRLVLNLRRRASPLVVDAPGIWVGAVDGEGDERFVHWETIAAVVVFDGAEPGSRRLHDGVGLRLRSHPDVVAVRRVLGDWKLDRVKLETAVARYAPGVPVVDGPGDLDHVAAAHNMIDAVVDAFREMNEQAATSRQTATDDRVASTDHPEPDDGRTPQPPGWEPGWHPIHRERYTATDPRAYLAGPTWTSEPSVYLFAVIAWVAGILVGLENVFVGALFVCGFNIPLVLHVVAVRRRSVRFAADAPGVFFGEALSGEADPDHTRVPWDRVRTVVLFSVEQEKGGSKRAIGVTTALPGSAEPVLGCYRVFNGWNVDRRALETAVRTFAPQVPVVDGPPLGRGRLSDLARAALRHRGNPG